MTVYIYVVDRDFGFAPNPFHGTCTLATCKPVIRRKAQLRDWVIGVGGKNLKATGRCIFAMEVTDTMCFDDYWASPKHKDKIPVRNGSRIMMNGDNIYHKESKIWRQADSHHSKPDGSPEPSNIKNDTQTDQVLISDHFYYFGDKAPEVPKTIFEAMGYRNGRHHRVFKNYEAVELLTWLRRTYRNQENQVLGDPFQFKKSAARYSAGSNKVLD